MQYHLPSFHEIIDRAVNAHDQKCFNYNDIRSSPTAKERHRTSGGGRGCSSPVLGSRGRRRSSIVDVGESNMAKVASADGNGMATSVPAAVLSTKVLSPEQFIWQPDPLQNPAQQYEEPENRIPQAGTDSSGWLNGYLAHRFVTASLEISVPPTGMGWQDDYGQQRLP